MLILGYELFGFLYFGGLLPATHTAKVGGGSPFLEALSSGKFERFLGTRFLLSQGPLFATFWIASGLGALAAVRRLPAAAWAMGAAGLVFIAYAYFDWMPRYRFFVPPLPFLAIAHAVGLAFLAERFGAGRRRLGWALASLLVALGAFDQATRGYDRQHNVAIAVAPRGAWPLELFERAGAPWEPGRQEIDAWFILRESDENEWIACCDIGFMGTFARNPIWDIRGLVTPKASAFLPLRKGDPTHAETQRAMLDELFEHAPAYILLPERPQGMAPVPRRFRAALEGDPRTAQRYDLVAPFMPGRVVWRRKGLTPPSDLAAREGAALARFPTYATETRDRFVPR